MVVDIIATVLAILSVLGKAVFCTIVFMAAIKYLLEGRKNG